MERDAVARRARLAMTWSAATVVLGLLMIRLEFHGWSPSPGRMLALSAIVTAGFIGFGAGVVGWVFTATASRPAEESDAVSWYDENAPSDR